MNDLERRLAVGSGNGWQGNRDSLMERAEAEGLIDLAFERHSSPFGDLLVFASEGGIVRVALAAEDEQDVLADLSDRLSGRIGRLGRPQLTEARQQLDQYFAGRLRHFDLDLDWTLTRGFRRDVLRQTVAIPYGATASYAELADLAGSPRAVRAAGSALATNPLPIVIPCHRVLRSDGAVGSYLGGTPMKQALLNMEQSGV